MSGEKTEQPTHKKLDDSRKNGQLPQRKNVLEAFVIVSGVIGVASLWRGVADSLFQAFDAVYEGVELGFDQALGPALWSAFGAISAGLIFSGVLGIGLLLLNLLLNRFNFAPAALKPRFEKLNPVNGLKGIFSKSTFYNFARLLLYFTAVTCILYLVVRDNVGSAINASACGMPCLAQLFPILLLQLVVLILVVVVVLALLDFRIQTMIFMSMNKMSKDDVKREFKGMQGDPLIKGMRQKITREDLQLPSPREVTHVVYSNSFLVAVLYEPGVTPFVVMKARGKSVSKIQAQFRAMGVRCVNLPEVARQFHRRYAVSTYMDALAAPGMAKLLRATGQGKRGYAS